jgi:hypothetical protein
VQQCPEEYTARTAHSEARIVRATGCDVDHPVRHSAAGQAEEEEEEGRGEGGGGGTPPPHSAVRAVLGYDTTGDGRPDAFDTNQDGRLE